MAVLGSLCFAFALAQLFGQANVGAILGNVKDTSGGVMVGATVTLIDPATKEQRTMRTNQLGDYVFKGVRPSPYTVMVEMTGFRTAIHENVILGVAQTLAVDFTMEPGAVTNRIEVRGEALVLEPTTSFLGTVIAEPMIRTLPTAERDVFELVRLSPSVVTNPKFGSGKKISTGEIVDSGPPGMKLNQISINGGRNLTSEFLLDDTPNTGMGFNWVAVIPPLDAVQEFNVLTNSYPAKYGRTSGGVITVVTKTGTNSFHGTAWEFLRNDNLDATNFFTNREGQKKHEFHHNQFGFTAGGPVRRNKTFFFGSYEGYRILDSGPVFLGLPIALERAGDFSQSFRPDGSLREIYDPFTTRWDDTTGTFVRDQFMGCDGNTPNVICPDRFDPVAVNLLKYIPEPNRPGDPLTHVNNFFAQEGFRRGDDEIQTRIDHNLNERHTLFGRFSWNVTHFTPSNLFGNIADSFNNPYWSSTKSLTLSYNWTLSPNTLLNVRYGLMRERDTHNQDSMGFDITELGFPTSLRDQFETRIFPRFDIDIPGGGVNLGAQYFSLVRRASTTQSLAANLSKVIGRHSIEAGFDLRLIQGANFTASWPTGQYQFDAGFTNGPNPLEPSDMGNGLASFLLGTTSGGYAAYDPHWFLTNKYYAFYIQDDIKVTPKLTLNLGLRYDYEAPLEDRYNQLSFVDFNSDIPISVTPVDVGFDLGLRPEPPFRGGPRFPGAGGLPKGAQLPDRNDFGPRLGLAYRLTPKTAIRMAYGILYPGTTADNSGNYPGVMGFNPITGVNTSPDGLTPYNFPDRAFLLSNPFPNGLIPVEGSSKGLSTGLGQGDSGLNHTPRHAYYQQWNFGIQRELPAGLLLNVAYVGSHGLKLADFNGHNYDELPNQYLALGDSLFQSLPNPFFGVVPNNTSLGASDTTTRRQLLRPYPQYDTVNAFPEYQASSLYHAFQMKVEKRTSHGLSLLTAYTFSKSIDTNSSTNMLYGSGTEGYQDPYHLNLERSVSAFDRTHVLNITFVYELPFGPGKALGSNTTNRVARQLIRGWMVGSILSFATGFPLGVGCGICSWPATRPDLIGDPSQGATGPAESRMNRYFNVDAFAVPQPYRYGNAPRFLPHTRGPGQANTDLSIMKDTPFAERYKVQFRAEFFNLANRPEFGFPDLSSGSPSFGQINSQVNDPRRIQFGLRLAW
jgi:hypothetical protein